MIHRWVRDYVLLDFAQAKTRDVDLVDWAADEQRTRYRSRDKPLTSKKHVEGVVIFAVSVPHRSS
jgi:hypothetical protein